MTSPYVWRNGALVRKAPIEAERVELHTNKAGSRVAAELRSVSPHPITARVSVTSTLTDAMRPETRDLGRVSIGPGETRQVAWPVACKPEPIPYALTFRFAPLDGSAWQHRTRVFGVGSVTVAAANPSLETVHPRRADLPDRFWVSRGPWEYRRARNDAHSGRAYLRILSPTGDARFTRMETGVRVNPGRRCYGRLWLRVVPRTDRPIHMGYGVAVCLYGERGRWTGPSTTVGLPPLREANTWTQLDFTFVPGPAEREAWIYLDVRPGAPAVDVDDLAIGEGPLLSAGAGG